MKVDEDHSDTFVRVKDVSDASIKQKGSSCDRGWGSLSYIFIVER